MRVITTSHKEGFEQYGYRWVESLKNWPKAEFRYYVEDFTVNGVENHSLSSIEPLQEFKERHKNYIPPDWDFDVVRFSNKVFAAWDAFKGYDGICVWLDADCVTFKKLPNGFIENLVKDHDLALFQRKGMWTETGFWVMRGDRVQELLDTWVRWYTTDSFKGLLTWHDCVTLDATLRRFKGLSVNNLSGKFDKEDHPMCYVEVGKYIDHTKGSRKEAGFSPENKNRKM